MFFGGVPPFSHHTISVAGRQSAIGQGRALPAPQQSPRLYSIGGLYYISFRESGGCKNRRWQCLGSPGISPSCAGHKPAFAAALPSPIFPRRRSFLPPQLQRVLRADGLAHAAAGVACRIQYYFPRLHCHSAVQAAAYTLAAAVAAAGQVGRQGTGRQLLKGLQRAQRQPAHFLDGIIPMVLQPPFQVPRMRGIAS